MNASNIYADMAYCVERKVVKSMKIKIATTLIPAAEEYLKRRLRTMSEAQFVEFINSHSDCNFYIALPRTLIVEAGLCRFNEDGTCTCANVTEAMFLFDVLSLVCMAIGLKFCSLKPPFSSNSYENSKQEFRIYCSPRHVDNNGLLCHNTDYNGIR